MKQWICKVCGYKHSGEQPPETCPICGVGPDEFELVQEEKTTAKRWKCTICDYVHTGDEPPEVCPVCGKGRDVFILLLDELKKLTAEAIATANDGTINSAMDAISYGLYVVASKKDDKINGQTSNTIFQLTATPPQIGVCLNKNTLTHEYVTASGVLAVSVLDQNQSDVVRKFGYQSGRTVDKFKDTAYYTAKNGCPILADCLSYLEATVIPEKTIDVGSHTLFVAQVTSGRLVSSLPAMTYAYYRLKK
jgi:flavin reductase (DIM6/NTAB) family NADH-FMN oxidoreductase RutF/rubredoxin